MDDLITLFEILHQIHRGVMLQWVVAACVHKYKKKGVSKYRITKDILVYGFSVTLWVAHSL